MKYGIGNSMNDDNFTLKKKSTREKKVYFADQTTKNVDFSGTK